MKLINPGNRLYFILILVLVIFFITVLATGLNKLLFLAINSVGKISGSFLWSNLTFLGDTLPVCAVMIFFIRKKPEFIWSGIISTILATLIVNILKHYLDIHRPAAVIDSSIINVFGPVLHANSFPSGHTVTIFTFTGLSMYYFRSSFFRILMISLAVLVGISRIVVGAHWPTDVLAGAVIGLTCSILGIYIVSKTGWKRNKVLQVTLGFLLLLADLYLIFFYDCKYPDAHYLQLCFGIFVLIFGGREYYMLLRDKEENE